MTRGIRVSTLLAWSTAASLLAACPSSPGRLPLIRVGAPQQVAAEAEPHALTVQWSARHGRSGRGSCQSRRDWTLWAWGLNADGQIGDGTTAPRHAPVQIGSGFATAAAAGRHAVALKGDGSLWAWGNNGDGQLGDGGGSSSVPLPVSVP